MNTQILSKKQELNRGWRVLFAAALGAGTGVIPLAFYSFGALVEPLTNEFGWSRSQITTAPLFLSIASLLAGAVIGALADRFGARRIILTSQILLVAGFAAMTFMKGDIWTLYVGYFLLAILGAGTMTMTWARVVTGWFMTGRGLALGLSLVGTGLIGAALPTYITWLVSAYGWKGGYIGLAALPLILGIPLTFLFFQEAPPIGRSQNNEDVSDLHRQETGHEFKEAMRTLCFWQMSLSFFVAAVAISAINVNALPLLMDRGIDRTTAAALGGLIGIAVTMGRLISGYFLDIFRGPLVAMVMFALPAIACALLIVSGSNLFVCGLAIILVGLCGGAEHDIAAYFTAKYFGRRHFGAIYGLLYTLYGVGAGIGPFLAGMSFDKTGSYAVALVAGAVFFAAAALLIVTLRAPASRT